MGFPSLFTHMENLYIQAELGSYYIPNVDFNAETGNYLTGTQMDNAFPLFLDLVPESSKEKVVRNLVVDIAISLTNVSVFKNTINFPRSIDTLIVTAVCKKIQN